MHMVSDEGEHWRSNGIELTWWPAKALMEMRFVQTGMHATGADAKTFVDQVERWTGSRTEGFGMLVDCMQIVNSDPAWRAVLNEYFRDRGPSLRVAWFNTTIPVRVMVEMFVLATPRVQGKVFAHEADARAFLREGGYG